MKTGSSNLKKFKNFQIRWKEKLGLQDNPYLIRWTFLFFGYSIRIHHWLKSDDNRFFHDHSADLISVVLKGHYWNVTPFDPNKNPSEEVDRVFFSFGETSIGGVGENKDFHYVEGIFNSVKNFFHMRNSIWFSKAEDRHYLKIPKEGAWTLMFEGRPRQKWGFFVKGHKLRPLEYFHRYGIIQDENYQ